MTRSNDRAGRSTWMLFASTSAVTAAAPVLGLVSLAFGFWYAAAAWSLMPYPF